MLISYELYKYTRIILLYLYIIPILGTVFHHCYWIYQSLCHRFTKNKGYLNELKLRWVGQISHRTKKTMVRKVLEWRPRIERRNVKRIKKLRESKAAGKWVGNHWVLGGGIYPAVAFDRNDDDDKRLLCIYQISSTNFISAGLLKN